MDGEDVEVGLRCAMAEMKEILVVSHRRRGAVGRSRRKHAFGSAFYQAKREHFVHISHRFISRKTHVLIFRSEWREQLYTRTSSHNHMSSETIHRKKITLSTSHLHIMHYTKFMVYMTIPSYSLPHPTLPIPLLSRPDHIYRCIPIPTHLPHYYSWSL